MFDALDAAVARGIDLVIADTAGRLHTKVNLMDELAKIRRIVDKRLPGAEPETLFVLDATTGQNGLAQARAFHEAVGLTGVVLTKLDSTSKGGIVFAIEDALKVPVRFVGVGEKVGDLLPFDPDAFVAALFAYRLLGLRQIVGRAGRAAPDAVGIVRSDRIGENHRNAIATNAPISPTKAATRSPSSSPMMPPAIVPPSWKRSSTNRIVPLTRPMSRSSTTDWVTDTEAIS